MYMNVTEVESALVALASAYPAFCELITLPNQTAEGRTSHAVRLGTQAANAVDAYYLTGGVHAREWGSCEILVNLATDLCEAYAGGTGVQYGGKYYSTAEVRALMEQINIVVFPCVNPDGRDFSQSSTTTAMWRKNRNPADSSGDPNKVGIDINRNQDFLWNFQSAFAPGAVNTFLASSDPSVETYHGHAATSEAETKNINYIHDTYKRIRWYVDVHSFSEDILYVWGDDEMQLDDSGMTFQNSAFNGQRGLNGDTYKEFIPDGDLSQLTGLANAFSRSLAEVRGKLYIAKPGFSLYATSGTNDDYAYSRHFKDSSRSKTLSFTVEWGTVFQPVWTEMEEIIKDVSAGLMGLGLEAIGIDSYIVSNRDTFSSYEVETLKSYPDAFYVVYDGFSTNSLVINAFAPAIQFLDAIGGNVIPSISATATTVDLEIQDPNTPQRIMYTFQVDFTNTSAFTAETRSVFLQVSFAGIVDVAQIQLLKQPNPYMVDGPISWLSTDVRVFQIRPGEKVNSFSGVTCGNPDSDSNAPYAYIQGLLNEFRGYGNNPALPFESISQDEGTAKLELSRTVNGVRVMNFAVAKVRYRANTQDAQDVRVFFRTFNVMVSNLAYTTNPAVEVQNYRRTANGATPLLGLNTFFSGVGNQIVSIPYFAEPRVNTATQSMTGQTDNFNKHTITHTGGAEAYQYFGCWLDFNQTDPQFPLNVSGDGPYLNRIPILQFVRGIHQCLVAEIRFQPGATDPIPNGATPSSSDRLSQRNLAIVESDNPGVASTHLVQHTFLLKASTPPRPILASAAATSTPPDVRSHFDELVIRWNDVPKTAESTLYSPDWNADEILELASVLRPGPQLLKKIDHNTISCPVGDVSYIPIPARSRQAVAGLLTLQLPQTVRTGQQFKVDIQQHSGLFYAKTLNRKESGSRKQNLSDYILSARKVLGAFRVRILVEQGDPLLRIQIRNLAVLRYIFEAIPKTDSWRPVFERYIDHLADKVKGLGVDPGMIPPSADDPGIPGKQSGENRHCLTGKVQEVIFDCFGDFAGFVLDTCEGCHHFHSREKRIGDLILQASRDRLLISVCIEEHCLDKIREIIVL